MRVAIRLLGVEVLAVELGQPPRTVEVHQSTVERPVLEAGPGGSFDFGFTAGPDELHAGRR